jgi:hypothetical protein
VVTLKQAVAEIDALIDRLGDELGRDDYLDALDEMAARAEHAAHIYADDHAEADADEVKEDE